MKIQFKGKINRLDFFLKHLLAYTLFFISLIGLTYPMALTDVKNETLTNIFLILLLCISVYLFLFVISLYVRRGNDFGKTTTQSVLSYFFAKIPFLGIIFWWQYQFTKGDEGEN